MKHNFWRSRTYWGFFLSYMILIVILVALMAFVSWFEFTRNFTAEARQQNEDIAYTITSSVNSFLEQLMISAQKMGKTRWVYKLYANSDIFTDYFHANRRAEIINEFSLYQAHPFVQKTALFFSEIGISVSTQGWIPTSRYLRSLGVSDEESQKMVMDEIRNNDSFQETEKLQKYLPSNILFLTSPLENTKESRAYICFFVDKNLLLDFLKKQMPNNLVNFHVRNKDTGKGLLSISRMSDNESENIQEIEHSSLIKSWSYSYAFDNSKLQIPLDDIAAQMKLYPVLFMLGIVFSGILAFATYRPFGNLLRKVMQRTLPDKTMGSGYSIINFIENSFETLHQENLEMRKNEEHNIKRLRPETIKRLLKGYFDKEEIERDMNKYNIPFTDDNYYQTLLLITDSERNLPLDPNTAAGLYENIKNNMQSLENCHCEIIENLNNDILIVAAFSNEKAAEQVDTSFIQRLIRQCEPYLKYRPLISAGMPHKGFVGISISYRWAMEQRAHMSSSLEYAFYVDSLAQERYFYPIEWEIQLISSLKAGNASSVQSILNELYRKNIERSEGSSHLLPDRERMKLISSIMETLLRVISELNLSEKISLEDMNVIMSQESFANKWNYIQKYSLEICRHVEKSNEAPTSEFSRSVINYVDEHFCDSELCLKTLSEHFNVSVQTISKIFKSAIGDTFYNYLYKKRMEYACTLLEETNSTMRAVARQVGYENEYSFKRAFIRFTGLKPKDYMQNHLLKKNVNEYIADSEH